MPKPTTAVKRAPPKPIVYQEVTTAIDQFEHHAQGEFFPIAEIEVDGVEMGVLSDGTPYLHLRGLARMCDVDHSVIQRLSANWDEEKTKPRGKKINALLRAQGFSGNSLFIKTRGNSGEIHAFTDAVCMAILEYYAFEANQLSNSGVALRNYRLLARDSFRSFIYKNCHYDPSAHISDSWKNFHERILLNEQMPSGYFSIFKEIADLVLRMIQQGCALDHHTVPDASVGIVWSKEWSEKEYDSKFGARQKFAHFYPDWFPQSAVNPVEAWIYPDESLATFRRWMEQKYLPENFPNYVATKVKKGALREGQAQKLLQAVKRPQLN